MDDPPEQSRWREWLGLYSDVFGVIGGLVLVIGFLLWLLGVLSGGLILIPVTVAATLLSVWITGLVFVTNRDPLVNLGSVWTPGTPVLRPSDHLSLPSAKSTDPGLLLLDQLEGVYELKKLEPNLVFAKGSLVGAHEDDQWRVIEGNNLGETAEDVETKADTWGAAVSKFLVTHMSEAHRTKFLAAITPVRGEDKRYVTYLISGNQKLLVLTDELRRGA